MKNPMARLTEPQLRLTDFLGRTAQRERPRVDAPMHVTESDGMGILSRGWTSWTFRKLELTQFQGARGFLSAPFVAP